ncbi:MAG: M23 family metallopeptidase [Ignavibacteria bacterium]|nr:M23 family metallopeptidase [Ignavibacteria bacterium]
MKTGLLLLLLCAGAPAALFLFHQRPEASAGKDSGGDPVRAILSETDWNDYQWPTDASTKRTSCFCEFRANHFHAGIDVSTGMQTGFKVFASRGGWLHSVSFEPFGYGWILTIKQPDGYSTSYAHLKGFPAKIRAAYLAKLTASGHSYGLAEFAPDEVPVKKGEVVAYTGDTGAGPPHLHFEVRDKDDNPVNPGLARHLRPLDSIAPEPRQLCFMPMDARSTVNGRTEPLIVSIGGTGPKSYRLAGVPVLRGRVGVLLRAHDRANDAVDYPTPYLLDMRVDGKPYFESRFDRIQDRFGWHIRIDRDHAMMKAQQGEFRKLFREEGKRAERLSRAHRR